MGEDRGATLTQSPIGDTSCVVCNGTRRPVGFFTSQVRHSKSHYVTHTSLLRFSLLGFVPFFQFWLFANYSIFLFFLSVQKERGKIREEGECVRFGKKREKEARLRKSNRARAGEKYT